MDEVWKACPGHPGYEVSNQGTVQRTAQFDPYGRETVPASIAPSFWTGPEGKEYLTVNVSRFDGTTRKAWQHRKVHLLVLEAFVGPRPHGLIGCHNDGDKNNNRPENLRWDTYSSNSYDTVRHGNHHQVKKTECLNGHDITTSDSVYENAQGYRRCKLCQRARAKAQYLKVDYRDLL